MGTRLSYGFSNLLFADLAASYEGSEQFAPGHRYGLFPAGFGGMGHLEPGISERQ